MSIVIVTLNVNGMSDNNKRNAIYYWCGKKTNRYCLLAGNPYSTDKVGLNSMWNHGLSNSMGVAILFSEKN